MQNTIKTILGAKRKRFLQSKPIFVLQAVPTEMDLFVVARRINSKFVVGLSQFLRVAGYGTINDTLTFRENLFAVIEQGDLTGYVTFAQDELGNAYAYDPESGSIHFAGTQHVHARMADNFHAFLAELIRRDYNLVDWRANLNLEADAV